MGIKGLLHWVRQVHPHLNVPYDQRWKALKNKRVALDGTLLTHRFHLGDRARDGRTSPAVRGWYSLIKQMKQHNVQPIAVWDERGERQWKAPEARKRLAARAMNMARKMHEERRQMRLVQLRRELTTFSTMTPVEQSAIRLWWKHREAIEEGDISALDVASSARLPPPVADAPTTIASAIVVSRFAIHLTRLTRIVEAYQFDSNPELHEGPEETLLEAFEQEELDIRRITGYERAEETDLELDTASGAADKIVATALWLSEPNNMPYLDARLAALEPATVYRESPRQKELSDSEGQVYDLVFDEQCEFDLDGFAIKEGMEILDSIDTQLQAIFKTYDSALNVPLEGDHEQCRELLRMMGVPIIWANVPYEAEGLASSLATAGIVDYVGTEDSDVIAYGGTLLRNITDARKPLVVLESAALREATGLSATSFRDLCVLMGTDASPRIHNVGAVRAFKLIKAHGSIEGILENEPEIAERVPDVDEFMRLITNARNLFDDKPPVPADSSLMEQQAWSHKVVRKWLYAEHRIVINNLGFFDGYEVDPRVAAAQAELVETLGQERPTIWDDDWNVGGDEAAHHAEQVPLVNVPIPGVMAHETAHEAWPNGLVRP